MGGGSSFLLVILYSVVQISMTTKLIDMHLEHFLIGKKEKTTNLKESFLDFNVFRQNILLCLKACKTPSIRGNSQEPLLCNFLTRICVFLLSRTFFF